MNGTWPDVIAELRGARLAVYDALLTRGEASLLTVATVCPERSGVAIAEAIRWLEAAHFVREVVPGSWRPRSPGDAEKQFMAAAGMKPLRLLHSAERVAEPTKEFKPANAAPSVARVHDYQVRMFAEV